MRSGFAQKRRLEGVQMRKKGSSLEETIRLAVVEMKLVQGEREAQREGRKEAGQR